VKTIAIALFGVVLATTGTPASGGERPKAAEGFAKIQKAEEADFPTVLPDALVAKRSGWDAAKTAAWRRDFAVALARTTVKDAREAEDRAIVRLTGGEKGETAELPLRFDGSRWIVATSQPHVVEGGSLDRANGPKAAKLRLTARTTNGPYGESAFSFAHVTADPKKSANRMDLWYCHNGDLHGAHDSQLAEAGKTPLAKLASIPLEAKWDDVVTPKKDGTYVLHAFGEGRRDFYVRFRVTALSAKAVEIEWQLLGTGYGSPPSIHAENPLQTGDGEDGYDGLCGKNG
jgi:hypothetical protein